MAKRIDRSVSTETRRRISEGLKRFYRREKADVLQERYTKHGEKMRRYWATIPTTNNNTTKG